jgi:hypothetical protein
MKGERRSTTKARPSSTTSSLQPRVWIISSDHWPRACLRAELIERGYDATGFVALKDAVDRLMAVPSRRPALLVIDLRGQIVDDILRNLLSRQGIPVLAINNAAYVGGDDYGRVAAVLRRPITLGSIAEAIERLVSRNPAPSAE